MEWCFTKDEPHTRYDKDQIVTFANRFFNEKYVAVLKNQGVDSSIVKIEKPAITPIPLNREAQSEFLQQVVNAKVQPIEPKFVDFNKDLSKGNTAQNMPVLYVKNNENGLFTLSLRYPLEAMLIRNWAQLQTI